MAADAQVPAAAAGRWQNDHYVGRVAQGPGDDAVGPQMPKSLPPLPLPIEPPIEPGAVVDLAPHPQSYDAQKQQDVSPAVESRPMDIRDPNELLHWSHLLTGE